MTYRNPVPQGMVFNTRGHNSAHSVTIDHMASPKRTVSADHNNRRHIVWHHDSGSLILVAERIQAHSGDDAGAEALIGAFHPGQQYMPSPSELGRKITLTSLDDDTLLSSATAQLAEYFAGRRQSFDLPLAPELMAPRTATDFRQCVWHALQDIPYGQVTTYGELALTIGKPGSAQAVGQAVGRNPLSVLIPCHRVIGSDGSLTGYAGGIERKIFLLQTEGVEAKTLGVKRQL